MNQHLSTYFAAIQTERENRDLALSRGWTPSGALPELNALKALKGVLGVVTAALVGMATTITSLVR
jgi:hypothetical protein